MRRRVLGQPVRAVAEAPADPALVAAINRIGVNVNQLARSVHRGSAFQDYWHEVGDELRAVLAQAVERLK